MDDSSIVVIAGQSPGGRIGIVADFFLQSPDSIVDSAFDPDVDANTDIRLPGTVSSIAVLPQTYINAADQLSERCGARTASRNSFIAKGRAGVPLGPGDLAPALASGEFDKRRASRVGSYPDKFADGAQALSDSLKTRRIGCEE